MKVLDYGRNGSDSPGPQWFTAWMLTHRGEWLMVCRAPDWWQATVKMVIETHGVMCLDRLVLPSGQAPMGNAE